MLHHLLIVSVAITASMTPHRAASAHLNPGALSTVTQSSAIVEQLLAFREELRLDDEQVRRLKALAADLRRQESVQASDWYARAVRQLSSKPWIHGRSSGSAHEARAAAFAILRPDQRPRAAQLLNAPGSRRSPPRFSCCSRALAARSLHHTAHTT